MPTTVDPTYPLFPIFCFLGLTLSLIPLPWHLQAWNSGTVFFMLWSALASLNLFVNSVVWHGNTTNWAPIWCEISIRITMAASVAIPASSLCINRRLHKIASVQAVSTSTKDRIREILVDCSICLGFPLVYTALQYIVQGHRFDILEDIGCFPAVYNTIPTYFLSVTWPLVVALISACYCVATLMSFNRRRLEFSSFLRTNNSALTFSRYFRLMALAMADIMISGPLAVLMIYLNATSTPIAPWVSWEDTHFNYGRIERIPALFWRNSGGAAVGIEFSRWVTPVCGIIFFAFFGFAEEAIRNYKKAWVWFTRPIHSLFPEPPAFGKSPVSDTKEKATSFGRKYVQPNSTFSPESSTSSTTLSAYSYPSPPSPSSLGDLRRNDSLTTIQVPMSSYSPPKSKPESFYSSSEGPLSPTLTPNSLPEYELKWV